MEEASQAKLTWLEDGARKKEKRIVFPRAAKARNFVPQLLLGPLSSIAVRYEEFAAIFSMINLTDEEVVDSALDAAALSGCPRGWTNVLNSFLKAMLLGSGMREVALKRKVGSLLYSRLQQHGLAPGGERYIRYEAGRRARSPLEKAVWKAVADLVISTLVGNAKVAMPQKLKSSRMFLLPLKATVFGACLSHIEGDR